MSEINKDTNDGIIDIPTDEIISIDLYLLWRSHKNDNYTIQTLFDPEAKFDFELVARLSDGKSQDQNPCVYRLHIDLTQKDDDKLTVKHKKTVYSAIQYQLRI